MAKSRLHFVLVQDRTGLTNEELAKFKEEMVGVIERYFVIDKTGFDIAYKRNAETTTLFINSPIIVRRQEVAGADVGARGKGKKFFDKKGKGSRSDAPIDLAESEVQDELPDAANSAKL